MNFVDPADAWRWVQVGALVAAGASPVLAVAAVVLGAYARGLFDHAAEQLARDVARGAHCSACCPRAGDD